MSKNFSSFHGSMPSYNSIQSMQDFSGRACVPKPITPYNYEPITPPPKINNIAPPKVYITPPKLAPIIDYSVVKMTFMVLVNQLWLIKL